MATIEELDDDALLELARRRDPLGVLSFYVNADPSEDPQAAAIDIGNRYRELQHRTSEDESGGSRDVARALERLQPEVDQVTRPSEPGRGRIVFVALSDGWVLRLDSQLPVANRVVLDAGPFIHPLLELLDEGRRAGLALLSSEGGRLLEWHLGKLEPVTEIGQDYIEAAHERAGQIGGGPAGQFHTPMREHQQARDQERDRRLAVRMAALVADTASERGWERVVLSGAEQWPDLVGDRLPEALQPLLIREPRVLTGMGEEELKAAVTQLLHQAHAALEKRLVEQVQQAGLGGTGALGLSEVAAALNEGRVAHLVYDPQVRYAGSVGSDGTLQADTEAGPGGQPGTAEPRLSERLVERALATGAKVSPVEGAADGALSEAAGIGALLRW